MCIARRDRPSIASAAGAARPLEEGERTVTAGPRRRTPSSGRADAAGRPRTGRGAAGSRPSPPQPQTPHASPNRVERRRRRKPSACSSRAGMGLRSSGQSRSSRRSVPVRTKPRGIPIDLRWQPIGVRASSDHEEEHFGVDGLLASVCPIAKHEVLQPAVAPTPDDLGPEPDLQLWRPPPPGGPGSATSRRRATQHARPA